MNELYIKTMEGIGDNIYIRPLIKYLAQYNKIYLKTVLPDLYRDIRNVLFVKDTPTYRTQKKVEHSESIVFVDAPKHLELIKPFYEGKELLESNIVSILCKQLDIPLDADLQWDLPDFSKELEDCGISLPYNKKIAVIRPATVRREWVVTTRPPDPSYLFWASSVLKDFGYHVISIADLQDQEEWLLMDVVADDKYYSGELSIYATLELISEADIVVGGSGFIIPATASTNAKLFTIFGGRMGYESPAKLFHPTMRLHNFGWAVPDFPCRCVHSQHNCNKYISKLDVEFMSFLQKQSS